LEWSEWRGQNPLIALRLASLRHLHSICTSPANFPQIQQLNQPPDFVLKRKNSFSPSAANEIFKSPPMLRNNRTDNTLAMSNALFPLSRCQPGVPFGMFQQWL
jgi:hypothetical protein